MFVRRCLSSAIRTIPSKSNSTFAKPNPFQSISINSSTSNSLHSSLPVSCRFFSGHTPDPNEPPYYEQDAIVSGRQYEVAVLGNFPDSPSVSPFGTLDRPALIFSHHHSRIVGCVGGENLKHKLLWFNLKEGKKHVCSECGQVFKLVNEKTYKDVKHFVDRRTQEHYNLFGKLSASADEADAAARREAAAADAAASNESHTQSETSAKH